MFEKKFSLKHVIKNFPKLTSEHSQIEEHFGVPWTLLVEKHEKNLSLYLYCHKETVESSPWSINVDYNFLLASEQKAKQESSCQFDKPTGWGWPDSYNWEDVIKNDMTDNCVTVVCHVKIKKMSGIAPKRKICFEKPLKRSTDIVVVKVGEQKFNVLKSLLAFRSPYFRTLFFGDFTESNESEVELKEVDADDFQSLLDTIYGELVIQAENVEGVLKLADQFDVAMVREKCADFLMQTDGIGKRTKLRLADKYQLEKLKIDCLKSISSAKDLKNTIPSDLTGLHHSTVLALLEKSVGYH